MSAAKSPLRLGASVSTSNGGPGVGSRGIPTGAGTAVGISMLGRGKAGDCAPRGERLGRGDGRLGTGNGRIGPGTLICVVP